MFWTRQQETSQAKTLLINISVELNLPGEVCLLHQIARRILDTRKEQNYAMHTTNLQEHYFLLIL